MASRMDGAALVVAKKAWGREGSFGKSGTGEGLPLFGGTRFLDSLSQNKTVNGGIVGRIPNVNKASDL